MLPTARTPSFPWARDWPSPRKPPRAGSFRGRRAEQTAPRTRPILDERVALGGTINTAPTLQHDLAHPEEGGGFFYLGSRGLGGMTMKKWFRGASDYQVRVFVAVPI